MCKLALYTQKCQTIILKGEVKVKIRCQHQKPVLRIIGLPFPTVDRVLINLNLKTMHKAASYHCNPYSTLIRSQDFQLILSLITFNFWTDTSPYHIKGLPHKERQILRHSAGKYKNPHGMKYTSNQILLGTSKTLSFDAFVTVKSNASLGILSSSVQSVSLPLADLFRFLNAYGIIYYWQLLWGCISVIRSTNLLYYCKLQGTDGQFWILYRKWRPSRGECIQFQWNPVFFHAICDWQVAYEMSSKTMSGRM